MNNQLSQHDHVNNNGVVLSSHEEVTANQNGNKKRPIVVRATHEYVPVNNDEIRLNPGDLITITNLDDGGWWEGTHDDSLATGWFPSNYVVMVDDLTPDNHSAQDKFVAMSDFVGKQSDEYKRIIVSELVDSEVKFIFEMEEFYDRVVRVFSCWGGNGVCGTTETIATLKQSYSKIIETHKSNVLTPLQSLAQSLDNLRVGHVFMAAAPNLEAAYSRYCSYHPRFVQFVEGNRGVFEGVFGGGGGDEGDSVLRVIMCLSGPFRRVERYGGILKDLDCHVEGFHGDKGDLGRAVMYYRGLEKTLTTLRKQKEMELEVLTPGCIKEFEGPDISTLGEIMLMDLMYIVTPEGLVPRYFVLFSSAILILAYDTGDSSFTYKGRVNVGGVTLSCLGDDDDSSVGFEIGGPTLHPIQINCPTHKVKKSWLQQLTDVIRSTRCYSSPHQQINQNSVQTPNNLQETNLLPPKPLVHHHSTSRITSTASGSSPLTPPVIQAWNITRLRPSPPFNPFLAEFSLGGGRGSSGRGSSGGGGGGGGGKGVSNEEDFAVLSIVDGFCERGGGGGKGSVLLRGGTKPTHDESNSQINLTRPNPFLRKNKNEIKSNRVVVKKYSWCCGGGGKVDELRSELFDRGGSLQNLYL